MIENINRIKCPFLKKIIKYITDDDFLNGQYIQVPYQKINLDLKHLNLC